MDVAGSLPRRDAAVQQDQLESEAASAAFGRPWVKGDGRAGPRHHWVLHVGAQEQCPSSAMFTKVKNINNTHYAPPVVSTRSRWVQESKCVCIHAHTHALAAAGTGYRSAQDYSSQAAVNTDKYSIRPVLPTAVRELWQAQCFPPSCERPGVFSAVWGARVPVASGPNSVYMVLLLHQENWRGATPSPAPSSPPIHPSVLCPLGVLQETGVQCKKKKKKRKKKKKK